MIYLTFILQSICLCLALSSDAFATSLAYGAEKIKIPLKSAITINIICSCLLACGLILGNLAENLFPKNITSLASFIILFTLALIKLFDFSIKQWITKTNNNAKKDFHFLKFHFLLQVICDSTQADTDASKILSVKESCTLALALSLDGFTAGISAGLSSFNITLTVIISFIMGMLAFYLGDFLGVHIASKSKLDLSWLSSIILIILAFLKLR